MTTQVSRVRQHLEAGKTITPMQAIAVYGIFRLSSVIEDLRAEGIEVDCVLKYDEMGKQYGEYRLRKPIELLSQVQVKRGHGVGLPHWVRRMKTAKVIGCRPAANRPDYAPAWLVRFQAGKNLADEWMNDKELIRAD